MDEFLTSLLVQGLGSLILGLVGLILSVYRPRRYFFCWTLAWISHALWLFLLLLSRLWIDQVPLLAGWRLPILVVRTIAGWEHVALWLLGSWYYRDELRAGIEAELVADSLGDDNLALGGHLRCGDARHGLTSVLTSKMPLPTSDVKALMRSASAW